LLVDEILHKLIIFLVLILSLILIYVIKVLLIFYLFFTCPFDTIGFKLIYSTSLVYILINQILRLRLKITFLCTFRSFLRTFWLLFDILRNRDGRFGIGCGWCLWAFGVVQERLHSIWSGKIILYVKSFIN
jgi:hypothetical protein